MEKINSYTDEHKGCCFQVTSQYSKGAIILSKQSTWGYITQDNHEQFVGRQKVLRPERKDPVSSVLLPLCLHLPPSQTPGRNIWSVSGSEQLWCSNSSSTRTINQKQSSRMDRAFQGPLLDSYRQHYIKQELAIKRRIIGYFLLQPEEATAW